MINDALTGIDPTAWKKLEAWANAELVSARRRNDAIGLSDAETSAIRGEIRLLKRILDLPNAAARNVEAQPEY